MGGQIQKLFIGDLRLKRFVIKFLAHSLVKVHMILHKKTEELLKNCQMKMSFHDVATIESEELQKWK